MAATTQAAGQAGRQTLLALLRKLAGEALLFVEERLLLAEEELRGELLRLQATAWAVGLAAAAATAGLALASAGVIVLLAGRGRPLWALLLGTGAAYLVVGAAVAARLSRAARGRRFLEHTLGELEKDRKWLRGER